ncbi:MAG: AIR synthase family protein [Bacillota bacterium]|nr:AIR synthase family protein [Bacillota bacterium]
MKIGKLNHEELQRLVLDRLPHQAGTVLNGPGIGLDCAAVRFSDGHVVLTSDPITGATADIGRLSIHVSCNDIAACGIRPSVLMMVLIAPPDCQADDIRRIVDQAAATARQLNVSIVGGHTEISDAVSRFVIITTAIGFTYGDQITNADGGRAGDTILMTKTAGIEGTAILAADQHKRLLQHFSQTELNEAVALMDSISVIEEGAIGGRLNVHAMHDATEGGILGACWEIAEASGLGCVIHPDKIPLETLTRRICEALAIDPLRLIASGSLLIVTDRPDDVMTELTRKGILCTAIGQLTEDKRRLIELTGGVQLDLQSPGPDELYKTV